VGTVGALVMSELRLIERAFPWIPWAKPIEIQRADDGLVRWGCRICIMRHGLRGEDIERLWPTAGDVMEHIKAEHIEKG
jgi:hypothetical protein